MNYQVGGEFFAFGEPTYSAFFKQNIEDFQVEEILGFEPSGEGEHLFLWVEKRGLNTNAMLRELSACYGIPQRHLGVAGLKDRQALTRQWVSLPLPLKQQFDLQRLQHPDIRILDGRRHQRKLKRGAHKGNRFRITLHNPQGNLSELEQRLERIRRQGVPNYFGPQRFGSAGDNVTQALSWFRRELQPKGRHLKGLYLSAVRAWLFNRFLSWRVADGSWEKCLEGECLMLEGSNSWFGADSFNSGTDFLKSGAAALNPGAAASDNTLTSRLEALDIHPSGPLWGKGESPAQAAAAVCEARLGEEYRELCMGLEAHGLQQERRALRMKVGELALNHGAESPLVVEFVLNRGGYATTVLRELLITT